MQIINDYFSRIEDLRAHGYDLRFEYYLKKGLELFRRRADFFLLYTALYLIVLPFGSIILAAPMAAGFFIVARRLDRKQEVFFDHFFDGFRFFIPLLLLSIVSVILISIGFIAFILPGIYLAVAYTFASFFVVFADMGFWDAMESSRKLVAREWFSIFGLVLILALINLLGAIAFGVGLLFTIPITYCALYVAFDEIVGS